MWQENEIKNKTPDIIRKIGDMSEVIFDKEWLKKQNPDTLLYYVYQNITKKQDGNKLQKADLRYDITVIPPFKLGKEFIKTASHYHEIALDNLTYPEVYQVLAGQAIFLIQKKEQETNKISDIAYAKCSQGDIFFIPPNYGHTTINPLNKELIIANWISTKFKSIYKPYKEKVGASYYYLTDKTWQKNPNYANLPTLKKLKGKFENDMYQYINNLDHLVFLNNPLLFPYSKIKN